MKKMMFVALAHLVLSANCAVEVVDGIEWNYRIVDGEAELYVNDDEMFSAIPPETEGDIAIPNKLGECPLTRIGSSAFAGCERLTSVKIPYGVKRIGSEAFFYCPNITNIAIASSVEMIASGAFRDCTNLKSLQLPEGLICLVGSAFSGCRNLKTLVIPSTVTEVYAPFSCDSLEDGITVAEGNSRYFSYCGALYEKSGPSLVAVPDMRELTEVHPETKTIGRWAFYSYRTSSIVALPTSVTNIAEYAFYRLNESCPMSLTVPASVTSVGAESFGYFGGLVVFEGNPPQGLASSMIDKAIVRFPRKFAGEWQKLGYGQENFFVKQAPFVKVLSAKMRETDPTIMDIEYKVVSANPNVRVRVLAFKDCIRSFANVIRAETFVDGTEVNVGDSVTANVVHKLAWKVSADYGKDLTKMCVEVLAREDDLLQMSWIWIPKSDSFGKMKVSYNTITERQVFDALMWLYADKDNGLFLWDGRLSTAVEIGGHSETLVWGSEFAHKNFVYLGKRIDFDYREAAARYVIQKMGWCVLSGDVLVYANAETRKELVPAGIQQYAYQIVEE